MAAKVKFVARVRCSPAPSAQVENTMVEKYGWHIDARMGIQWVIFAKRNHDEVRMGYKALKSEVGQVIDALEEKATAPYGSSEDFTSINEVRKKILIKRINTMIKWWREMDDGTDRIIVHNVRRWITSLSDNDEQEFCRCWMWNNLNKQ